MSKWIKIIDKQPSNEKVGDMFIIKYEDDDDLPEIFKVIESQNKLYLTDLDKEYNYPLLSDPAIIDNDSFTEILWRYLTDNELMAFL